MASDRRPVVRAPDEAWQRLGSLLQLRRGELGYRRRPAFTREHGINIRLVTDIENAYRPNTFLTPTLRDIAQAYEVTYESVIAVLGGRADALEAAAAPGSGLPPAPMDDPGREGAVRPYATAIWEQLLRLAGQGITAPSGHMLGLSHDDAKVWDGSAGAMSLPDRAWLVADIQRRRDARKGAARDAGAAGA